MLPSTDDKKKKARKDGIDEMLVKEYEGYANFIIGKVGKIGRQTVLEQTKTAYNQTEFYWLKKEYEKIIEHVQEMRIKRIPLEIGGSEENPIRIIFRASSDSAESKAR